MMNKHWNLVSTCLLVIIIISVGYTPITAQSIEGLCTSDSAKDSAKVVVNVNAKGWAPDGPEISVEVVAKESSIKSIQIWTETVDNKNHIGSWTLMPGYKFVHCGIGMSTLASNSDLNLPKITFEWKPPRANDGPIQVIPSQGQGTPSQVAPTPSPSQGGENKRSLVARQGTTSSTPSYGPIVFKGVLEFKEDSGIYSFKSDVIPISNATNATNATNTTSVTSGLPKPSSSENQGHATSSIDNKHPTNSPSSAANSKFLFEGFNLFFILTLSVGLVTL